MRDVFEQYMTRLLSKHYSNNDQTAAGIEKRSDEKHKRRDYCYETAILVFLWNIQSRNVHYTSTKFFFLILFRHQDIGKLL